MMRNRTKIAFAAAGLAALTACAEPQSASIFTTAGTVDQAVDLVRQARSDGIFLLLDTTAQDAPVNAQILVFDGAGKECYDGNLCGRYDSPVDVPERMALGAAEFTLLNDETQKLVVDTKRLMTAADNVVVLRLYAGDPGLNDERVGNRIMIYNSVATGIACTYRSNPADAGPTTASCVSNETLSGVTAQTAADASIKPIRYSPGIPAPKN